MCRRTIGMLVASALAISGCGSTSSGATTPRPPAPVNLSIYIDNGRVSVSPTTVGAGPVAFIITNQASQAESVSIQHAGQPLANTGPINPQATAQVTVDLSSPGTYSVSTAGADAAPGSAAEAVSIHVGAPRPSSSNDVLQP